MKVSRTRCSEAMQVPLDSWTIEGRMRTSDVHNNVYWGTCILCGKKHYNRPYDDSVNKNVVSTRVNDSVLQRLSSEAKRTGVHESVIVRRILIANLNKSVDVNTFQ